MIEKSSELAAAINTEVPGKDEIYLWWLGQSGFVIRTEKYCLVTDPYLSTTLEDSTKDMGPEMRHIRMMPIPVLPEKLTDVDFILCSHDHGDHYDAATVSGILRGSPGCRVIVPPAAAPSLLRDGVPEEKIIRVGEGDMFTIPDLEVTAIRAKHNQFDYTPEYGYPYVGYIIHTGGVCIYHAGDCILYDRLKDELKRQEWIWELYLLMVMMMSASPPGSNPTSAMMRRLNWPNP